MKKIYLVETISLYYGEDDVDVSIIAFDTMEKAKASFDERVSIAKATDHLITGVDSGKDSENLVIEETETTFEMYWNGYYSEDHISVRIVETDLN